MGAANDNVWECCFTARVASGQPLLALRIDSDAARPLPAPDNLLGFCFPLSAAAARPSAFLVTEEFSFTLTGGDGSRLHGFCRKTNDPTAVLGAIAGRAGGQRFPQVQGG